MLQQPLPYSFYQQDTVHVAHQLIGKIIIRRWNNHILAGIITETEAYAGFNDPASHAYSKKTERNAAMFGLEGHAYIYLIYGNHYCLNFVAKDKNAHAGAVLIRAIKPIAGIEIMHQLRNNSTLLHLTNGPGKICQALDITRTHNMHDITKPSQLYVTEGMIIPTKQILQTPRIGISKAQDYLWRFIVKDITI